MANEFLKDGLIGFVVEPTKDRETSNTTDDKSKSIKMFVPELMSHVQMDSTPVDRDIELDSSIVEQDPPFNFSSTVKEATYITVPPIRNSNQEQPPLAKGETVKLQFMNGDPKKVKYSTETTNEKMRTHDRQRIFIKDKTSIDSDEKEYECLLDSKLQIIRLFMNDGRGEVTKYQIEINGKEGFIQIKDYEGQEIKLITKEEKIISKNKTGTYAEIKKDTAKVFAETSITLDTPTLIVTGNIQCKGSINAAGSIIDAGGNTNHHGH